jgi:hypothetical protein
MVQTADWGVWPLGSAMGSAETDTVQRSNAKASEAESHPYSGGSPSPSVNDIPGKDAHTEAWSGGSCVVGKTARALGRRATASVSGPRAKRSERDWDPVPNWSG